MEEGFDFLRGRFSDGEILSFIELSILYLESEDFVFRERGISTFHRGTFGKGRLLAIIHGIPFFCRFRAFFSTS